MTGGVDRATLNSAEVTSRRLNSGVRHISLGYSDTVPTSKSIGVPRAASEDLNQIDETAG